MRDEPRSGTIRTAAKKVAAAVRTALVRSHGDRVLAEFTTGAPVKSLRARLAPDHLHYEPGTLRTIVRNGIRFELDLGDYMQWCVYFGISIEPRAQLYELVQPGQIALDVGTNVGEVLLNFAKRVGERGEAFGFEVNPGTFRHCMHNVALNSFQNVRVFNVGLGSEAGEFALARPTARNSGGDRIISIASESGISVRVTTLDEFVREQRIERVDLMKIDVEGFEVNVLRGAQATIEQFRPTLFIEVDDENLRQQGSNASELMEHLERWRYRVTSAEGNCLIRKADRLEGRHFDIIARP